MDTRPHEFMPALVEFRIIGFSTALKLYHEDVLARVRRDGDRKLTARVEAEFSATYEGSFAYRLAYAMRNSFLHGARDLVTLHMTARLAADGVTRESEARAELKKSAFITTRTNGAVRQEVRETVDELDLFELTAQAYTEVRLLQDRLTPLLHPEAPAAAALISRYIEELRGERPHFHEYIDGWPTRGILQTMTLDKEGLAYVAAQVGKQVDFDESPPSGPMGALPVYPRHD